MNYYILINILCISIFILKFIYKKLILNKKSELKEVKEKINDLSIETGMTTIQIYVLMIILFLIFPVFFLSIDIINAVKKK